MSWNQHEVISQIHMLQSKVCSPRTEVFPNRFLLWFPHLPTLLLSFFFFFFCHLKKMTNRCMCVCVCFRSDIEKSMGRAAGLSYKFPHNRNENRTTIPVSPSEPWGRTCSVLCWWHLCCMNTGPHILGSQSPENQHEKDSAYKCAIPPGGMVKPAEEAGLCRQDGRSQAGC